MKAKFIFMPRTDEEFMLPPLGYIKHSGQVVDAYLDSIYEPPIYRIVAKDGWEGLANINEIFEEK